MFKKAKRANFRRRNESDEDELEERPQLPLPLLAPTSLGPVLEEIPFMETSSNSTTGAASDTDTCHSNGLQVNLNSVRAVKKEKKVKEPAPAPGPAKSILLSFDDDDDEGNLVQSCVS